VRDHQCAGAILKKLASADQAERCRSAFGPIYGPEIQHQINKVCEIEAEAAAKAAAAAAAAAAPAPA